MSTYSEFKINGIIPTSSQQNDFNLKRYIEKASNVASNYKPSPFKRMILFSSSDCIYCRQASKISRNVASQLGNRLIEYNINDFPQLVDEKKITIVPTLVIGEGEQKLSGPNFSEGEIVKMVFNASCT